MTDIRERAARAMYLANLEGEKFKPEFERLPHHQQERWLSQADAVLSAIQYREIREALEKLLNGCMRYDENPDSLVAMDAYLAGKDLARAALAKEGA